jgi:predicted transposase YbfD/YdcC
VVVGDIELEKTNEIKHVKPLFENVEIEGAIVTADALHTQKGVCQLPGGGKKSGLSFHCQR